jgi:membrane-bound lytic murein transglycosylase F
MNYINIFKRSTKRWLPGYDFRIFYAQAKAESNLRPDVISPAGAVGIMQIMPATGGDLGLTEEELLIPEKNIDGGIRYMRQMIKFWETGIPDPREKLYFALASYNAGAGNIHKAYKMARQKRYEYRDWAVISALCLPDITGRHSVETINYVARVKRFYRELLDKTNKKTTSGEGPVPPPLGL